MPGGFGSPDPGAIYGAPVMGVPVMGMPGVPMMMPGLPINNGQQQMGGYPGMSYGQQPYGGSMY